ncbi:MAG: 3-keto-disaccharide hydrolase [Vicinamibacteraceae bacterium]
MKKTATTLCLAAFVALAGLAASAQQADDEGWIPLFDGKTLDGWKVGENADTFTVADGAIIVDGPRAHLFYVGPVEQHDFENFELKADVMTTPGSNSGMYFHTAYQDEGWPKAGFEIQVNNSHKDPKRTGSLYNIQDNYEAPAKDNEWFTQHIIVRDNRVVVQVNGKEVTNYTMPASNGASGEPGRTLSRGTFALQGHDPDSKVLYKNIMVKPLP